MHSSCIPHIITLIAVLNSTLLPVSIDESFVKYRLQECSLTADLPFIHRPHW